MKKKIAFICAIIACFLVFSSAAYAAPKHSSSVYKSRFQGRQAEHLNAKLWRHRGKCCDGKVRSVSVASEVNFLKGGKVKLVMDCGATAGPDCLINKNISSGRVYVSKNMIKFKIKNGKRLFCKNNKSYFYRIKNRSEGDKWLYLYSTKSNYFKNRTYKKILLGYWA